jgi:Tfp pilus assembly protein PilW
MRIKRLAIVLSVVDTYVGFENGNEHDIDSVTPNQIMVGTEDESLLFAVVKLRAGPRTYVSSWMPDYFW